MNVQVVNHQKLQILVAGKCVVFALLNTLPIIIMDVTYAVYNVKLASLMHQIVLRVIHLIIEKTFQVNNVHVFLDIFKYQITQFVNTTVVILGNQMEPVIHVQMMLAIIEKPQLIMMEHATVLIITMTEN